MNPILILSIGIATVLALILVFRTHAFLALIASAIVVSLLAPGAVDLKIQRVADSFGVTAGNIAIVIALAAIIGECMMVSGAADRIVQAFLGLLGEKRASWALLGSGYVLAIPVFFDTVFYLLVPLARSLYRRTGKNYLLSLMAIAAGGAITHTLVPPTPGPLVMASTLGIDIGVMILVGALVALPAAVVGLAFSKLIDRWMPVPFRDDKVVGTEDDQPEVPVDHPPLWLSLMPVVLPVLLISTNTALTSLANSEGTARLRVDDIRNWQLLLDEAGEDAGDTLSPAARLMSLLPESSQDLLRGESPLDDAQRKQIVDDINAVMTQKTPALYDQAVFDTVLPKRWKTESALTNEKLSDENRAALERLLLLDDMLQRDLGSMQAHDRQRLNRLLLEAAYPNAIAVSEWNTPLRQAADVSSLFGNPNLALLFSTVIAMFLVYRQKKTSLTELGEIVETSLMSGGTIILITAAGGAFGAMLKLADIKEAIETTVTSGSAATGTMFLLIGYGVAVLMKVALGSSTVAMIFVSSMLAAMVSSVNLGFHPVYLATAIGAGSLMGSWMNDSGFWIFTKMGRLTETESLRSWTLLLAVLSAVSFGMTLVLSKVLPLV